MTEAFWMKAAQLILSLSILIVLHEMGHMVPAKLFKTRVEKFYLFFNPYFALFRTKLVKGKRKFSWFSSSSPKNWEEDKETTEYGVGWLPLGGFVKIAGMIDESMDKEQMAKPAESWEFRSKKAWQRLIIMIGGVVVNFLLAIFIYAMVVWVWGTEYIPNENAKYGIHVTHQEFEGADQFMDGDKIINVGGETPKTLTDVTSLIIVDGHREVLVEREGKQVTVQLPDDFDQQVLRVAEGPLFIERWPAVIDSIPNGTACDSVGLLKGDSLVSVNGEDARFFYDLTVLLDSNSNKVVDLGFYRKGEFRQVKIPVSKEGTIGFHATAASKSLGTVVERYSFFSSFPKGVELGVEKLTSYVKSTRLLFTKEGAKQMGGFGAIGNMFPAEWNWQVFWTNTAWISIVLAFMNLLPIPALDGGHVIFLIWEMLTGRAVSQKVLERAQMVGMVLLLALLLYANGMDLARCTTG